MLFSTKDSKLHILLGSSTDDMGFESYSLAGLPRRISDANDHLVEMRVDPKDYNVRLRTIDSPAGQLSKKERNANWLGASTNTRLRLYGAFLIAEDPQRRLDARNVATLMHQTSLVQHILQESNLKKVLIGDEVGLGKTIEAGLLVRQLIDENPYYRVLYLAPAQLVKNVCTEFEKLDIRARDWAANGVSAEKLASEQIVIASIHRAVHQNNFDRFLDATGEWDVLIVDECHHLTSYTKTENRSYKLVKRLIKDRLSKDSGRVVLLSGTPHQGSQQRFESILELISEENNYIGGRVIFRTKDRVADWEGNPLFPSRQINETTVVKMGEEYKEWYGKISQLYSDGEGRARGWAKGQALQWAASGIHAGLAFLTRLGMRRLQWNLGDEILCEALKALRPYRGGAENENIKDLFLRIQQQIGDRGNLEDPDNPEVYDAPAPGWEPNPKLLSELIREGILLTSEDLLHAKWHKMFEIIDEADKESEKDGLAQEKFVLFAQPVETVIAAAEALKNHYNVNPAIIIGDQNHADREKIIENFRRTDGPRFLVSSKAGGEGLNMQCARRLIHLDIPWNPMDMEQRVGRVHRFGSRKTIIVDTIVTDGSRERDMYTAARARLKQVAADMVAEEDFEMLFSRVMSLVPPEGLEDILANEPDEQLDPKIGPLIDEGYRSWKEFDQQYRVAADEIKNIDPGLAKWKDLESFIKYTLKAQSEGEANYTKFQFIEDSKEILGTDQKVPVVSIEDKLYVCGNTDGLPATLEENGTPLQQIGLNNDVVKNTLRSRFMDTGAATALLRCDRGSFLKYFNQRSTSPVFLLAFLRQELRYENNQWQEKNVELKIFTLPLQGAPRLLEREVSAELVRAIQEMPRIANLKELEIRPDLVSIEKEIWMKLRETKEQGTRYAVWPIAAIALVA
jgi:superfamily II DNA or RNA helicase